MNDVAKPGAMWAAVEGGREANNWTEAKHSRDVAKRLKKSSLVLKFRLGF